VFPQGGSVLIEDAVPAAIAAGLEARGHRLERSPAPLGGGQAIAIDRSVLIGGSDFRKDGMALGY
jgi:gamma-glutamyltranspeptidase/glutathione hydrolase